MAIDLDKKKENRVSNGIPAKPIEELRAWIEEARQQGAKEPEAMNLATVGMDGKPHNRMVLMRHFAEDEVGFFTNLESNKSNQIEANQHVSITMWWPELERQVRISGVAKPMDRSIVEAYFSSRPRNSQIAAWASKQSQPLSSMDALHTRFREHELEFQDGPVPLPEFWGGFAVTVKEIEFWYGRPHRLHERLFLVKNASGWTTTRMYP